MRKVCVCVCVCVWCWVGWAGVDGGHKGGPQEAGQMSMVVHSAGLTARAPRAVWQADRALGDGGMVSRAQRQPHEPTSSNDRADSYLSKPTSPAAVCALAHRQTRP